MGFSFYYTLAFMTFFGVSNSQWIAGSSLPFSLKLAHDDFEVQHGDAQNVKNGIQKQVQLKAKNNFDNNGLTYTFAAIPQVVVRPQIASNAQYLNDQNQENMINLISNQDKEQPQIQISAIPSSSLSSKSSIVNGYPLKQNQQLRNTRTKSLVPTKKIQVSASNIIKGTDHEVLGRNNYVEGYKDTVIGNSNKIIGSLQFVKGDGNYIQHHKHMQNELI